MRESMSKYLVIAELLESPHVSYWLKDAIRTLEARDPLDALQDARKLFNIQEARWNEIRGIK